MRSKFSKLSTISLFCLLALFFTLTLVQDSYSVQDENLVLYLPFDEGKGDMAKDTTKHKNNGQLHEVERTKGKYGTAVEFSEKKMLGRSA